MADAGYLISAEQFEEYLALKLAKLKADIQQGIDAVKHGEVTEIRDEADHAALLDDTRRRAEQRIRDRNNDQAKA